MIIVKHHTYSINSIMKTQALPSVLANVTHDDLLLDIEYVHEVSLNNINWLNHLGVKFNSSLGISVFLIGAIFGCIAWLWYQQVRKLKFPGIVPNIKHGHTKVSGTQTFKKGGVTNSGGSADQPKFAA